MSLVCSITHLVAARMHELCFPWLFCMACVIHFNDRNTFISDVPLTQFAEHGWSPYGPSNAPWWEECTLAFWRDPSTWIKLSDDIADVSHPIPSLSKAPSLSSSSKWIPPLQSTRMSSNSSTRVASVSQSQSTRLLGSSSVPQWPSHWRTELFSVRAACGHRRWATLLGDNENQLDSQDSRLWTLLHFWVNCVQCTQGYLRSQKHSELQFCTQYSWTQKARKWSLVIISYCENRVGQGRHITRCSQAAPCRHKVAVAGLSKPLRIQNWLHPLPLLPPRDCSQPLVVPIRWRRPFLYSEFLAWTSNLNTSPVWKDDCTVIGITSEHVASSPLTKSSGIVKMQQSTGRGREEG